MGHQALQNMSSRAKRHAKSKSAGDVTPTLLSWMGVLNDVSKTVYDSLDVPLEIRDPVCRRLDGLREDIAAFYKAAGREEKP
jgi:hypothetical protein